MIFDPWLMHKPHYAYYNRLNKLKLLGNCQGKRILDAACGSGKYAEELMEKGAVITGFDINPQMIAYATKRNKNQGTFFVHDIEQPLIMLKSNSFDIVQRALALHYPRDWESTIQEFLRVLKANGKLVISIEHPLYIWSYLKTRLKMK